MSKKIKIFNRVSFMRNYIALVFHLSPQTKKNVTFVHRGYLEATDLSCNSDTMMLVKVEGPL